MSLSLAIDPSLSLPPEEPEDSPLPGLPLVRISIRPPFLAETLSFIKTELSGPDRLPVIVYGAGAFSNQYNTDDHLASTQPLRTVRLALRYLSTALSVITSITDV